MINMFLFMFVELSLTEARCYIHTDIDKPWPKAIWSKIKKHGQEKQASQVQVAGRCMSRKVKNICPKVK